MIMLLRHLHFKSRRYRIKHLVVLGFGLLTLGVWLPIYLYINHVYAARLVTERGAAIHDLAAAVASVVAENLRERQREIYLLSQTPLFRRAALDDPELQANLERVKKSYPHYSWIGVADLDGVVRSATGNMLRGADVRMRPWFISGQEGPFFGDLHEALLLSRLLPVQQGGGQLRLIDFAVPLTDSRGAVRGVLGIHADWRWAGNVVNVLKPVNAAQSQLEILIVNRDNRVIHPQEYDGKLLVPPSVTDERPFVVTRWGNDEDYFASVVAVHDAEASSAMGWRILVRQPREQTLGDVAQLQRVMQASVLLSAVLFMGLVWWGAILLSRPLGQLSSQARLIEQGDETMPQAVPSMTVELNELSDALRGMASTLLRRKEALAASNLHLEQTVAERTAELAQANEELHLFARLDALTGLPNRLAANERLRGEFARMKRSHESYAVMMMDIDHFKRINDTHGHAIGDQVLQRTGSVLKTAIRESDFVGRFGGEEFMVLLPATGVDAARHVAEKIRQAVEASPDTIAGVVTLSIGLAIATSLHENEERALREADEQLYQAKRAGRNRVASASH